MAEPDTMYQRLGGHQGVVRLVDRFYELMDTLPEARTIRDLHPQDLDSSRAKLTLFLMMWTGGPRAYLEARGHPRMRARHLPFAIGRAEAAAWMLCMTQALEEQVEDPALLSHLVTSFDRVAQHMINQQEAPES